MDIPGLVRALGEGAPRKAVMELRQVALVAQDLEPTLACLGKTLGLGQAFADPGVGMFGLDEAWAPPTPFARVPVYVLVGAIRPQPAAVDGALVIQQRLTVTATIDHRFIDGFQGGVLAKVVRSVLEDPWQLEPPHGGANVDGSPEA